MHFVLFDGCTGHDKASRFCSLVLEDEEDFIIEFCMPISAVCLVSANVSVPLKEMLGWLILVAEACKLAMKLRQPLQR